MNTRSDHVIRNLTRNCQELIGVIRVVKSAEENTMTAKLGYWKIRGVRKCAWQTKCMLHARLHVLACFAWMLASWMTSYLPCMLACIACSAYQVTTGLHWDGIWRFQIRGGWTYVELLVIRKVAHVNLFCSSWLWQKRLDFGKGDVGISIPKCE